MEDFNVNFAKHDHAQSVQCPGSTTVAGVWDIVNCVYICEITITRSILLGEINGIPKIGVTLAYTINPLGPNSGHRALSIFLQVIGAMICTHLLVNVRQTRHSGLTGHFGLPFGSFLKSPRCLREHNTTAGH